MKRVALVQPSVNPPGGGNAVAAWILQALCDRYALTLLCWKPPDLAAVNAIFGTSLHERDFAVRTPSRRLRAFADALPIPLALAKAGVLRRQLARLQRRERFDVLIGANNEFDFGEPGIQYVHYPAWKLPRPALEQRWYHRPPGVVATYRALAARAAGESLTRIRSNWTLVNSAFIAGEVRALHGIEPRIVHPPVAGPFPEAPDADWEARESGFVCVGRFSPEKELDKVIAIVSALRERGHALRLHLVGDRAHGDYAEHIRRSAAARDWVELHVDVSRAELVALMARNRYGIHGMCGEHFGIAVAELQRAGCIPFVPDDAGPAEIVGGDGRIAYASADDAVAKIDRVLRDPSLRGAIRADCAKRRAEYSTERFASEIRSVVEAFSAR